MKAHFYLFKLLIILITVTIGCGSTEEDPPIPEAEEIVIEGRYVGGWSSVTPGNTYNNIPISAIIKPSGTSGAEEGNYEGEFFFTAVHTSCCNSGKNDGSLVIKIEDNKVTKFEYTDILPSCNGLFTGSGTIDKNGKFFIQFTGSDCEGEHQSASLNLTKST